MPDKSEGQLVFDCDDLLVNCFFEEGWSVLGKSVVEECFCLTIGVDLLVTCPCGVDWPIPGKSELVGWSVGGHINGAEDLMAPTGGGWDGATLGA